MSFNPYKIILKPANTEKSYQLAANGKYTFVVSNDANKVEVAMAVTDIFDVDVVKVRVINRIAKYGRWGRKRVQRKSAYKKAIVTLAPGQTIDLFEGV